MYSINVLLRKIALVSLMMLLSVLSGMILSPGESKAGPWCGGIRYACFASGEDAFNMANYDCGAVLCGFKTVVIPTVSWAGCPYEMQLFQHVVEWDYSVRPVKYKCLDAVYASPFQTYFFGCDLKIVNFISSTPEINQSDQKTAHFTADLQTFQTQNPSWTLRIHDRTFNGTGKKVSVDWDGKDLATNSLLPSGQYTATLTAISADGKCRDSKSLTVSIKAATLAITRFNGTPDNIITKSSSNLIVQGEYNYTGTNEVNWTIAMPGGSSKSGTNDSVTMVWNGKRTDGTMLPPGLYKASLNVSDSKDPSLSDSKTLNVTLKEPPPGQCGLYVQFGSSAHVASGNLAHNQELFGSRNGAGFSLYYNSLDPVNDLLGRGWSHNYGYTLNENSDGSVLISEPDWRYRYYTFENGAYMPSTGNYATLVKNPDGSFTLTRTDGQVYSFVDGKLAAITDRNGNRTTLIYANGNLSTVTDPSGRVITFTYDPANHLTSLVDPGSNSYAFSVGTGLDSVTQPDGGQWRYTYDVNGFMQSKTDPLNNVTSYIYDAQHRVISATDSEGLNRTISYPQTTETIKSTTFTEKDGGVWQYSYDTQKGTLDSKTDPQGGVTSYTYDAAGNRISTTGPDGKTTTSTYDSEGNMRTITDALEQTTSYNYNAFAQVTVITDSQGGTTTYAYDAKGNMTSLTDPTGATTTYAYDAKGNIAKITNAAGQVTTFTYDAKGNLASIIYPTGVITTYAYDAAGNVISITDKSGAITQFVYDNRNRLIKTIDPQGNATLYSYDANGNKLSETDANGNTTTFEYNSRNQLVKTIDALGSVTTYAYGGSACQSCGIGNGEKLTAITEANGNITSYLYDQLGRSVKEEDPLGNSTAYAYDFRINPVSKTDANGNTINFSYDTNGRLLKKSYPDGTEETFTYDAKGNLVTVANKNISYTFGYDAAGRMLSVADSTGKVISYEYDLLGNKTKMISPEGKSLTYTYDKANRLISIINGGIFTFGYDSKGQRSSLTYPNGDTATYGFDKQGRLTSLVRKNPAGNVISSNSYTLDKIGNRQTNTTQDGTSSYSYDNIYRLLQTITNTPGNSSNTKTTKGTNTAVQQQKDYFSYDPVGNRLTSANNRSYTYETGNQLISENGTTYSYDKNGNLTQKTTATETTAYIWDFENRLIKVVTPSSTSEYAYDPFGRRIDKKVTESGAPVTTRFFYDGQAILFDYDEVGAIGNRYIHGPNIDEPLAVTTGKDKYYYHADGLGSIIALTDQSGKVVQTYEYDSFGNLKDQKNRFKQPFTYTGREIDRETGLYYYRARYYDPMDGRFISKDPISFAGGDVNLYGYVQNNPINWTDPSGLASVLILPPPKKPGEGCGDEKTDCLVPDLYPGACSAHDKCYSTPGKTRAQCDNEFWWNMFVESGPSPNVIAPTFYWAAVRIWGASAFVRAQGAAR